MIRPTSSSGQQLYALLPAVYRRRDQDDHAPDGHRGDLARYLDACGSLLDAVRFTLEQRLADHFADPPESGRAAQEWMLPYLAELLDVRLVSPYVEGQRLEVARAVSWRQRKGTLRVVEEVVEAVGQTEAIVREGFERVAVTPRIGVRLLPAAALGVAETQAGDLDAAARHPGLPAVTPDLRRPSRAVRSVADDPALHRDQFIGEDVAWRQANLHGVPCFPDSYEDASLRTLDMRQPTASRGHAHPRRLTLFVPPPLGMFTTHTHRVNWSQRDRPPASDFFVQDAPESGWVRWRNPASSAGTLVFTSRPPNQSGRLRIENLHFADTLTFDVTSADDRIELRGVSAARVVVRGSAGADPVLDAKDCILHHVIAEEGLVRLESTTITGELDCHAVQASDCLLADLLDVRGPGEASCIRYSRIPIASKFQRIPESQRPRLYRTTSARPAFFEFVFCDADGNQRESRLFAEPGYKVLHPETPDSVLFGAEDGGELGATHRQRYSLAISAVLDKLRDFLPLGMEAAIVYDPRRLSRPPVVLDS